MIDVFGVWLCLVTAATGFPFPHGVTPLKAERSSCLWRLLFALALVLGAWLYAATHQAFFVTAVGWWRAMAAALAVTSIGFRLAPRLRQTTLPGLPFSHEVKPMLIGLAGMFLGAYVQGLLAQGCPKLQAGPQQGPG